MLALQRNQLVIQVLGGCHPGALRVQRNQKRQALHMQGLFLAQLQTPLEQARRQLAGSGHVHMRVGAVSDQAVGLAQHARRDIGVQIQAGHDRDVRPHQLANAGDQFTFTVVGMFGHSGTM